MLKRAYEKYGVENFTKEILFECNTFEEMVLKEYELVDAKFVRRQDTYNLTEGGGDGFEYLNRMGLNVDIAEQRLRDPTLSARASKLGNERRTWLLKNDKEFRDSLCKKMSLNAISNLNFTFKDSKHSDNTKQKMSESHKGKHTGSKNSQYGTMWITNGIASKKIKKNGNIPEGWNKGRKIKFP